MKSFKLIEKENSNHFERNIKFYKNVSNKKDFRIIDLIEKNDIKVNQYQQILNTKINYGIDLLSKTLNFGKKREIPTKNIEKKSNFDVKIIYYLLILNSIIKFFNYGQFKHQ